MMLRISCAIVFATSMLTSCPYASAEVANLQCTQTGPSEYRLSYSFSGDTHEVEIFATTDATGAKGLQRILKTKETTVVVHAGVAGQREFFFLRPDHGERCEVSIRHLALEGTPNFRDLGGYETTDGHFVRWGMIYRSSVLSELSPADMNYLKQTGIRMVVDFRSQRENAIAPEVWIPGVEVDRINLAIGGNGNGGGNTNTRSDSNGGSSVQSLAAANPSAEQMGERQTEMYRRLVVSGAPQFAKLFEELLQSDHLPAVYHCTGGRDRTGMFSALLLLTLGVPEKTVLDDYALTTDYLLNSSAVKVISETGGLGDELTKLTPEQLDMVIRTKPEYMAGALRTIDEKYGSFDNYRRQELHVSDKDMQELRDRLLTK